MNQDCTLKAEILGVDPEAEYQGRVYDQTVRLRPRTGEESVNEISVFDSDSPLQVTEGMIGQVCNVTLSIEPESDGIAEESSEPGVRELSDPLSKWSYVFNGAISEVDFDNGTLQLHIGNGCVIVNLNHSIREAIEQWDSLSDKSLGVSASRTDLIDIEQC